MSHDPIAPAPRQSEATLMKLERLITEREPLTLAELAIGSKELLARYERTYTGAISDVLREFALLDQALPSRLRPLRPERTVAGFAFTVKSAPHTRITGELTFRTEMLNHMHEDAFVVWDASGDERATMWGGVMTATAHRNGVRAACIDGGIRDTHQILEKDFPVFFKHQSPNGSLGRCLITHYQTPLRIGDVFICGGFPGHAVIVVDMAKDRTGKSRFLLAQSYMPAQEVHLLKNPGSPRSPWYPLEFGETLVTPEYTFARGELRRFR